MGILLRAAMVVIVLAALPAFSPGSFEAAAAVSTYSGRATFLAAAGATTTIDFSTNDAALAITNPPSDVSFNVFVRSGVIFQDIHSYLDLFIYTFRNAVIRANLPPGTITIGTDIAPFNQGAGTYISTGDTFQPSNTGSVQFFGAIAATPIQWVDFSLDGTSLMLDNFTFGAGPSQGWNATTPMPTSRFAAGAVRLQSGKVLVVGGHSFLNGGFITEADAYDPASGDWTITTPLPLAHRLTATALETGEILVVGDDPFGTVTPSAYLYKEASATCTPTEPPSRVRYSPVVSLLPSGDVLMAELMTSGLVLVAGGIEPGGSDIASAEFWKPASSQPLTPQQALGNLNYSVLTLVARGTLNDSDSLLSRLEAAISKLNKDNTGSACKQLKKFVNQVNALVTAGTLTPSVGQNLIEATLRVKDTIGCNGV